MPPDAAHDRPTNARVWWSKVEQRVAAARLAVLEDELGQASLYRAQVVAEVSVRC